MPEQWMIMKDAAKALGVSPSTISRLAAVGAIQVRESIANRKIKLVNVDEVRKVLDETVGKF
jgi:DNA-binding LacI/PurR family transcriptional regulator